MATVWLKQEARYALAKLILQSNCYTAAANFMNRLVEELYVASSVVLYLAESRMVQLVSRE
jgi:hypothetical protein